MALDYIIGGLLLISIAINILALGAFWISPGLRTTANRFVINLLVANVIACLALTPAIWINGGLKTRFHIDNGAIIENQQNFEDSSNNPMINEPFDTFHHKQHRKYERDVHQIDDDPEIPSIKESIESFVIDRDQNGNIRKFSEEKVINIQKGDENDEIEIVEEVIAEPKNFANHKISIESYSATATTKRHNINEPYTILSDNALIFDCSRFWAFDLAAALGKNCHTRDFIIM